MGYAGDKISLQSMAEEIKELKKENKALKNCGNCWFKRNYQIIEEKQVPCGKCEDNSHGRIKMSRVRVNCEHLTKERICDNCEVQLPSNYPEDLELCPNCDNGRDDAIKGSL